jgi:hypothetical protein
VSDQSCYSQSAQFWCKSPVDFWDVGEGLTIFFLIT